MVEKIENMKEKIENIKESIEVFNIEELKQMVSKNPFLDKRYYKKLQKESLQKILITILEEIYNYHEKSKKKIVKELNINFLEDLK